MSLILVTPLSHVEAAIRRYHPTHMVTLLSPEHMIDTPEGMEAERHLRLGMNDVAQTLISDDPPNDRHIKELIAFGRTWDGKTPMLVHCWAGISRSMAASFILMCDKREPGMEREIANAIRYRAPHAHPNPLMVSIADGILDRGGRMIAAVDSIGRGTIVAEGQTVELPLSPDEL
ncbi:MAG TPA: hypothetical protein VL971_05220 [Rhizomicrobium sp.]|nr:hypothetical protein [Rhizomicrobium sp.]